MGKGVVDHEGPEDDEGEVSLQGQSLGKGTSDDNGGHHGEHALEENVYDLGNALTSEATLAVNSSHKEEVSGVSDNTTSALPEEEGETNDHPQELADGGSSHCLHDDGQSVLPSYQTSLSKTGSWCLHEDEGAGTQHEGGVTRVETSHAKLKNR
jgi:hypothetical protein